MTYNGAPTQPSQYSSNRFGNSSFTGMSIQPANGPYPSRTGVVQNGFGNQSPNIQQQQHQQPQNQGFGAFTSTSFDQSMSMTPMQQQQKQPFRTSQSAPHMHTYSAHHKAHAIQQQQQEQQLQQQQQQNQSMYGVKSNFNDNGNIRTMSRTPMSHPSFERPSSRSFSSSPASASTPFSAPGRSPIRKSKSVAPLASPVFFHRGRVLKYDADV